MSLGVRCGSKLHEVLGLFAVYSDGKLKDLVRHGFVYASLHGVEPAFRNRSTARVTRFSFHPAADDIVLTCDGGYVVMDARTSAVGPGYHAFIVGFIDYLNQQKAWLWNVASAIQHFGDDTGFFGDRDFSALQNTMAGAFTELCQDLVTVGQGPFHLCNLDYNVAADYFAATSLGLRDIGFFEQPEPDNFFPWWDEGVTAATLRNMALCKMWLETSWQPPADASQASDLDSVKRLVDRAVALGAEFAVNEGAGDIDALLRGEALGNADDVTCVGYGRYPARYMGNGGWTLGLSGCYREDISDDMYTCSFVSDDRVVHLEAYEAVTPLSHLIWPEIEGDADDECVRFKSGRYWAILSAYATVEHGAQLWVWRGAYQSLAGSAIVTAISRHQDDVAWGEKVLRSVDRDDETTLAVTVILP